MASYSRSLRRDTYSMGIVCVCKRMCPCVHACLDVFKEVYASMWGCLCLCILRCVCMPTRGNTGEGVGMGSVV